MRITPSDLRMLQTRRVGAVPPVKRSVWSDGRLVLALSGALVNPLNASGWGWRKRRAWAAAWKEKVAAALLEAGYRRGMLAPTAPKRIALLAHVGRRFDSTTEGLRAACKPIPDGLKECGVIHDDRDSSGHTFVYDQIVDRAWRGVEVVIALPAGQNGAEPPR